ncbi:hypothetical protein [Erythrobacter sp. THAF29]|uniref:hypothetical protein n=1 Tax=Erythrobacter sp. THAF29 TaxID=2587851 RepID=UPI001268A13B|nr:hypothetical protein [Erythrobacter sp. THAF29]QFT76685.1 hypothetical protein FIU90_03915 [Erythrobacter sp. THAF29]
MIGQVGKHWHIILADLALILFVLTLSALSKTLPVDGDDQTESPSPEQAQFDPAQTLYRPVSGGPSLGEWLDRQPRDPRATVTIHVRHSEDDSGGAWASARALSEEAESRGFAVRTVVSPAEKSEIYAILGFDTRR